MINPSPNPPLSGHTPPRASDLEPFSPTDRLFEWAKDDKKNGWKIWVLPVMAFLFTLMVSYIIVPQKVSLPKCERGYYAIIRRPQKELLEILISAQNNGKTIRLITENPDIKDIPSTVVAPGQINLEGVLVDGSLWFSIESLK